MSHGSRLTFCNCFPLWCFVWAGVAAVTFFECALGMRRARGASFCIKNGYCVFFLLAGWVLLSGTAADAACTGLEWSRSAPLWISTVRLSSSPKGLGTCGACSFLAPRCLLAVGMCHSVSHQQS